MTTISKDIIEKIRLSNDIESIVREYLPDLKRVGQNFKSCCPFHNEKTPSFIVNPEKGIFRCFGCGAAGDIFKFVMLAYDLSWIEAVKKLAINANVKLLESKQDIIKSSEKVRLFDVLENSAMFYHQYLLENIGAEKARKYFEKRGINRKTIDKFKLGFAPKAQLFQNISKKGYDYRDLLKAGLIKGMGRGTFFEYMSERIVFPIFDVQGRIIAFGGRSITNQEPKYLNTPETTVYSKSSNLYGLFQTLPELRRERKIIILEGYIDVIVPQQFGIIGAVATLGTAFSQNHVKLISRYSDIVTLLFDSDDAGRTVTQKAIEILLENGIECRVSILPEGVDADEYILQNGKKNFLKLIEDTSKSAIDFMITRVCGDSFNKNNSPDIKAKAIMILLDFVSKCSNSIIQREYVKNISQNMNVNEEDVWSEFKKKQQLKYEKITSDSKDLKSCIFVDRRILVSLEESLLNFILNNRCYIKKISSDCFKDFRCKKVFELVSSGLSDVDVLNSLSNNEDKNWFSAFIFDSVKYNDTEEAFITLLRDIELHKLKNKRQSLEREVLMMSEGKKEKDKTIFDEYKKLTAILKGSGK